MAEPMMVSFKMKKWRE